MKKKSFDSVSALRVAVNNTRTIQKDLLVVFYHLIFLYREKQRALDFESHFVNKIKVFSVRVIVSEGNCLRSQVFYRVIDSLGLNEVSPGFCYLYVSKHLRL